MVDLVAGVWPVLPTPFTPTGAPDEAALAAVTAYALQAGVDGVVYPGVASEYAELTSDERMRLVAVVANTCARHGGALVVGGSSPDAAVTHAVMRQAAAVGAAAVMIMAPR